MNEFKWRINVNNRYNNNNQWLSIERYIEKQRFKELTRTRVDGTKLGSTNCQKRKDQCRGYGLRNKESNDI
jgi:hypothetical protein